jgi:23S rRNA (adenine2030-N6)-methyltransferase
VHKHVALTALLQALTRKDKGFLYLETHAGRGAYDLAKSAEGRASAQAIDRMIASASSASDAPEQPEIAAYAQAVAAWRSRSGNPHAYPGSPLVAAALLRAQDRAVLIELLPDEASALGRALRSPARAQVVVADGFERLKAFLPPSERRGLTLIDPPYEETRRDFARIDAAIAEALKRFETGVIAVWYPIKDARDTTAWLADLRRRVAREALLSELWLHPCDSRVALNGSGLLIVNPPFGVADRMRAWMPPLLEYLDPVPAGTPRAATVSGTRVRLL